MNTFSVREFDLSVSALRLCCLCRYCFLPLVAGMLVSRPEPEGDRTALLLSVTEALTADLLLDRSVANAPGDGRSFLALILAYRHRLTPLLQHVLFVLWLTAVPVGVPCCPCSG